LTLSLCYGIIDYLCSVLSKSALMACEEATSEEPPD
jgi:hypothetical protein